MKPRHVQPRTSHVLMRFDEYTDLPSGIELLFNRKEQETYTDGFYERYEITVNTLAMNVYGIIFNFNQSFRLYRNQKRVNTSEL